MNVSLSRSRVLALFAATQAVMLPRIAGAQTAPALRIGAVASESYAEPYYALDGGFFGKAGLNVTIQTFTTGGQITQAIAGGALDLGIADMIQVGNAVNRGIPFGFFAGSMLYTSDAPTTQLCIGKNGTVKTAKDLDGQAIGVNGIGSMAEISTREWLRTNGADPASVRFVEIPPSAMGPAIARGTVAAGCLSEPGLTASADDVRRFAKVYDSCAKIFYINSWFGNRPWIAQNAETVRRFTQAVYDAARWANANHNDTAPILAKYAKLEAETIRRMTRAVYATSLDIKAMQPVFDLALRYKAIEKPINAPDLIVHV